MSLAQTRERVHQEIEALQDEKNTIDVQISVHNKEMILLIKRSDTIAGDIERLSGVIPVLQELEEADR